MGLLDKKVDQRRLSVMKMTNHGNIAHHIGKVHEVHHKCAIKARFRQTMLFDCECTDTLWFNDWLSQWLRVFFLNECFNIITVYFGCRWIVYFFFMKYNCVRWLVVDLHHIEPRVMFLLSSL